MRLVLAGQIEHSKINSIFPRAHVYYSLYRDGMRKGFCIFIETIVSLCYFLDVYCKMTRTFNFSSSVNIYFGEGLCYQVTLVSLSVVNVQNALHV